MNTQRDLESELQRLAAQQAPSAGQIRHDLDERRARHSQRRRTTTWIAVAASVVVVAGGVSVTAGLVQHHRAVSAASHGGANHPDSSGLAEPDAPAAVIPGTAGASGTDDPAVPTISAPTGPVATAALVPLEPDTVTSPVTAQPPAGLTGPIWQQDATALAVKFIDADAMRQAREYAKEHPDADAPPTPVHQVGYVITGDRDGQLRTFGSDDTTAPDVTRRDYPIAGHDATLETAPHGTVGAFDTSAIQRLTWQLPDDRWIHVYSTGESDSADATQPDADTPSAALEAFAAGITDDPEPLAFGITVGLTLPGLDNVSRSEDLSDSNKFHSSVTLCPDGFDPMGAEAQGAIDLPCVRVEVNRDTLTDPNGPQLAQGTVVVSGDLAVHVEDRIPGHSWPSWAKLDNGLILWVIVPSSAELSNAQLAELAASVRLSPEVLMAAAGSGD